MTNHTKYAHGEANNGQGWKYLNQCQNMHEQVAEANLWSIFKIKCDEETEVTYLQVLFCFPNEMTQVVLLLKGIST